MHVLAARLREAMPGPERAIDALLATSLEIEARGAKASTRKLSPAERLARVARVLADGGQRLLLVLDELPIMVRTIADDDPAEALHLLRALRALRHEHRNVRLVCAGRSVSTTSATTRSRWLPP